MAENIDVLHERIKVLKEENERLKSLLIQHNIPFMNGELNVSKIKSLPSDVLYSTQLLSLKDKVELFQSLLKGVKMFLLRGGIAKQLKRLAINRCAKGNGIESFVIRRNINV